MNKVSRGIAPLFLLLPSASWALGLGDIRVETALNEPLVAEIPVLSASKKDLRDMTVRLAPKAAFDKLGLDRSYVLTQLRFQPTVVDGRPVIRITSRNPIREPFLDFLIEVSWPKGRLVREYTVLLDPPTLLDRRGAPAVRQAAAGPAYRFEQPAAPAAPYGGPRPAGGWPESVEVRPGDSLYRIARRLDPEAAGVGIEQLMVALYEANPGAFGGNMNLLHAGARLRIPSPAEVAAIEPAAARAEIARQTEQWRRGTVVAAAPADEPVEGPDAAAPQAAARGEGAEVAPAQVPAGEPAQAGAEEPQGRLEIVAAGAGEDGSVTGAAGQPADVQASLALARELAKAREEENAALKSRLAQLEEMLKRSERIIELQNRELEALRERIARLEAGITEVEPAPAPVEEPAAGQPEPEPETVEPPPEPVVILPENRTAAGPGEDAGSPLDRLLGNPLLLYGAGGGSALLLLLAFLALRHRGRRQETDAVAEAAADATATGALATGAMATGGVAATRETAEAISTGMFDASQTTQVQTAVRGDPDLEDTQQILPEELAAQRGAAAATDAEDVLSEADVYIAYGLYQQAEELLQEALQRDPQNAEFYVKLAEAYQREGRPEALAQLAGRMREAGLGEGEAWERVAALGRKLDPDNALYAGGAAAEAGPEAAAEPAAESAAPAKDVDLDLDQELPEAADATAWDLDTGALRAEVAADALPEDFAEAADVDQALGIEATQDLELPEAPDAEETTPPQAEDSNILEFDVDDLGLGTVSMETETSGTEASDPLTEEIQSDLETHGDLDLDLTDAELRVPEGLELDDQDVGVAEETVELDESLLQELESAINEIEDSGVFETPGEVQEETASSDTLFLDDEAVPEGKDADEQATQGVEDVLDLDTLMGDDTRMTFEVEPPAGVEETEVKEIDTELIDTAAAGDESSDTLVTDSGFTTMLSDSDEAETKLELARAYLEMGDKEGAKATLEELLESASDEYRQQAEELLRNLD